MKLWIDDQRAAPEGWIWLKTYSAGREALFGHKKEITEVSLDHNLGSDPNWGWSKTGKDLLNQLISIHRNGSDIKVYVHTSNPTARKEMMDLIAHFEIPTGNPPIEIPLGNE